MILKKTLDDFKKFALKGSVVDLAVGVIIGSAFGKVVSALVDGVLTPPLGLLIGGVDFSKLRLVLKGGPEEVAINYGVFLQAVVNFLIVAWALFLLIKLVHRLRSEFESTPEATPATPPAPPEDVLLLREIRDALKK